MEVSDDYQVEEGQAMTHDRRSIHLHTEQKYRRRRRIAGAVAAGAVGSVVTLLGGFAPLLSGPSPAAADSPAGRPHPVVHVVRPGDTLWGIVVAAHPHGDPRPLVDRITAELHGRPLQVGEAVEVP